MIGGASGLVVGVLICLTTGIGWWWVLAGAGSGLLCEFAARLGLGDVLAAVVEAVGDIFGGD